MAHRLWRGDPLALLHGTMSDAEIASFVELLIRAERSSGSSVAPLLAAAAPGMRSRLVLLERFASRNAAALACILRCLGREPGTARPPLPAPRLTPRSARARLELVRRGHGWAVRRIEAALPRIADRTVREALGVVRESHLLVTGVCRGILADLERERRDLDDLRSVR